jgi:hypothetical protein
MRSDYRVSPTHGSFLRWFLLCLLTVINCRGYVAPIRRNDAYELSGDGDIKTALLLLAQELGATGSLRCPEVSNLILPSISASSRIPLYLGIV